MKYRATQLGMLLVVLIAAWSLSAQAQVITATMFGTVTDKSTAIIPGAIVTVTNVGTGLTKSATTGESGQYRIEFLPVGQYRVTVSAAGFGRSEQTGITLNVNQEVKIDAQLTAGTIVEHIEVTSGAPLINTANAEVGTTVENTLVTELPIVNRNVYTLLNIIPGVQQNSSQAGLGSPEQHTSINGGIEAGFSGSVNYFLDGGQNVTSVRNAGNILPNPDAIQEFRVQANNYSAEYGRFSNGVINVITKSGTNIVHGSVFEFLRNDKLNAKNWRSTLNKAPLHRNQFGATLGAPIIRDRTFIFGSYAGLRESIAAFLSNTQVPTPAERDADHHGYFDFTSSTRGKPNTSCGGVAYRLCRSDADPAAIRLLDAWVPAGNVSPSVYQGIVPTPDSSDDFLVKIDHRLNSSHQLTGAYFNTSGMSFVNAANSQIPYSRIQFNWRQQNINLSDTWAVSPTTVNQIWLTYTRAFGARISLPAQSLADYGSSWVQLGPPGLPRITVSNYFLLGDAISGPLAGVNFYSLRDLVSRNQGRHNLRYGAEISLGKDLQYTNLNNYGQFTFNGGITGNGFADYLLGVPASVLQDQPVRPSDNSFTYAFFAQDDWRATSRLTLNVGLRWDLQTVPKDPNDFQATYVPSVQSTVHPGFPKGLLYIGDPGVSRGIAKFGPYHISPRFGFALDPFGDGKTAIRGGFGMFFGGVSGNGWNQPSNYQPFTLSLSFPNANSVTGAMLSNPYRNYPGGSPFPYTGKYILPGSNIRTTDLGYRWPYTYQMNLSVQRQIFSSVSASVGYVGSLNHNLPWAVDLNYPVFYAPGTGPRTDGSSSTCAGASNPLTQCGSSTNAANILARRPNPALGSVSQGFSTIQSSYHSLQIQVEQRMTRGLSLTSSYVWSKTMAGASLDQFPASAQNYNNIPAEYGRADTDVRHVFSTGAVWQFNYVHGASRLVRQIANGWQISPIFRMSSGGVLNILNGLDGNMDGSSSYDRARLVGDPNAVKRSLTSWFNTAAFARNNVNASTANAASLNGNTARNALTGPGSISLDLGIGRSFPIYDRAKIEFRAEATNAINHPNWSNPGTNINSPSTFGIITSAGTMRQLQVGARATF